MFGRSVARQLRHNAHYSVSVQQTVRIPIKFVHKKPLKPIIRYIFGDFAFETIFASFSGYSFMLLSFRLFVFCIGFALVRFGLLCFGVVGMPSWKFDHFQFWCCVSFCIFGFESDFECSFFHTFATANRLYAQWLSGFQALRFLIFALYCSFNILFTLFDSLNRDWNYSVRWKMIVERRCLGHCALITPTEREKKRREFNNHYDW